MHVEGVLAPKTPEAARDRYGELGPAARTVVREVAKAMGFEREEYDERVTGEVVATARDAIFASLLEVTVGTATEFDDWCDQHPEHEVEIAGSEHVDRVVWHAVPFAERVVAATFQHEEDAAVATLRRQAYGRIYRDVL